MKFDDVLVIKNGRNQKAVENPNGRYPIYGSGGMMGFADDYICEANTTVIGRKGSINNPIFVEEPFWNVDTAFGLIARREMLLPRYLYYFCRNYNFEQLNKTVTIPSLTKSDLLKIEIVLPTLNIQQKIVDRLLKVEQIIQLRKQTIQKLDELVKARFIEMFGDPETNPKGYEKRKLGVLAKRISDGVHAKPEYTETGKPFLSVVNINKGTINFDGCKFVSEEAYQKMVTSTYPERGDVLYTKVGATYGIPAYVDTDIKFCLYVSVCLIKPKHDEIDSRFLALSMGMPYIKRQADRRVKGIGVPDLHLNQINEFDVLCPPRNEQEAFVSFVEQIDKSKVAVQKALDEAQLLFDSLMQKYFVR